MIYTIQNEYLTVSAATQGAELQSIRSADGTEYLWQGDPTYWSDRALNIFPYVARLTRGQYELDGQRYFMRIHGLAMYLPFALTEHTAERMVFTLTDNAETYASYPRHFAFHIVYELRDNVLVTTYRVENRDERTMYFGVGGHPGFRVPLTEGRRFEDYRLRFAPADDPRRVGFTEACYLDGTDEPFVLADGQTLPLTHDLFDQDAIVLKNMAHTVTLEADGDEHSVTVRYPDMPYLGLWHRPRTDAPYVCIEPWSSLPSTQDQIAVFEQQPDLLQLTPGKTYENTWEIIINQK